MYKSRGQENGGRWGNSHVTAVMSPESTQAAEIFEKFIAASTFKSVLGHYRQICELLRLRPNSIRYFYPKLKSKLKSWKAQALWAKFDKRANQKLYNHGKACVNSKVLIIGAGPCGLRTAIEAQLLGAQVVVVEKRDRFSRNNVLHLWPFVITDLKALGAKKFYGKFCAGAIDHISIRQLQCILLKVALLLGVKVFEGLGFEDLIPPPEDQTEKIGWRARFSQPDHTLHQYEFDVLVGADGKRNTLSGFKRTEFRGKLAIAVTANFINKRSEMESSVQEISGVAFIFNQKFFKELRAETNIDLENIVYYKDETHYFVMTAKKQSLIDKGVIIKDLPDTQQLLHPNNVNREALQAYAREAADFSTNYQMPHLDFAVNHYGHPDVAMFDFTSMFAAENACRAHHVRGHRLLMSLVGDSLLEPFWPTGSGCARGFLSAFDAGWMMKSWASLGYNESPLCVLAERESIYRLLAQTTPRNLSKEHNLYTLDPSSRYPTINTKAVLDFQVRHLFTTDDPTLAAAPLASQQATKGATQLNGQEEEDFNISRKRKRKDSLVDPDALLNWCQRQVTHLPDLNITDLTTSFKDGLALCAVLYRYRPELIPLEKLTAKDIAFNNQIAFDVLESEYGVPPLMTGTEMEACEVPDKLSMISYLSQVHHVLRGEVPHVRYSAVEEETEVNEVSTQRYGRAKQWSRDTYTRKGPLEPSAEDTYKRYKGDRVLDKDTLEQARKRREDIDTNRSERLKKQRQQRELDTVRFVRSMRLLECGANGPLPEPSFQASEDDGLKEYRKNAVLSMREKAKELEKRIYFTGLADVPEELAKKGAVEKEDFDDRVKYLESKFKGEPQTYRDLKKPKDLVRSIGRIEKTDWNLAAIERKIESNPKTEVSEHTEKVPKWSKESYEEKMNTIERRMRANGEKEETIAKYKDVDAYLKRLEKKLREGSTLDVGLKGNNKVSNLASQLSSKLTHATPLDKPKASGVSKPPVVVQLPSSGSDLCYFCSGRVYLVERLSAEGKFFHRHCFKCHYCNVLLRLGNYIYDREGRYGGKFFCIPHFGLTGPVVGKRAAPGRALADGSGSSGTKSTSPHLLGRKSGKSPTKVLSDTADSKLCTPPSTRDVLGKIAGRALDLDDRGTTPERVEFENSLVEQGSDEEEYLSEEEWTDRNFGASANELDDTSNESEEFSDSDDDLEALAAEYKREEEAIETRDTNAFQRRKKKNRVPAEIKASGSYEGHESWQARYRQNKGGEAGDETESDLESDDYSESCAIDGDESHTATEGEGCGEEDEECEDVRRQRERRKMEIRHSAPPKHEDTSDTEVASSSDLESDTEIDTDSEFEREDHHVTKRVKPQRIPTIVIEDDKVGAEKSASMTSISELINAREEERKLEMLQKQMQMSAAEQLRSKLALQRTESNEALTAQKNLYLRRQYLLGQGSTLPKKSVSNADLGNKFKSFMDKISETQKMLHPAPEPSQEMQTYINSATTKPTVLSPLSQPNKQDNNSDKLLANNEKNLQMNINNTSVEKTALNFGETEDVNDNEAANGGLLIMENKNGGTMEDVIASTYNVVETVNKELVNLNQKPKNEVSFLDRTTSMNSTKDSNNYTLSNLTSVPSDVDDLFEVLAKDAILDGVHKQLTADESSMSEDTVRGVQPKPVVEVDPHSMIPSIDTEQSVASADDSTISDRTEDDFPVEQAKMSLSVDSFPRKASVESLGDVDSVVSSVVPIETTESSSIGRTPKEESPVKKDEIIDVSSDDSDKSSVHGSLENLSSGSNETLLDEIEQEVEEPVVAKPVINLNSLRDPALPKKEYIYQQIVDDCENKKVKPIASVNGEPSPTLNGASVASSQNKGTNLSLDIKSASSEAPETSNTSKRTTLSSPELVKNVTYSSNLSSKILQDKLQKNKNTTPTSTRRYEGYIPRFKDHISPLNYSRDKESNRLSGNFATNSTSTPVANTSAVDDKLEILEPPLSPAIKTPVSESPERMSSLKKNEKNVLNSRKKDGDVIHQLVLSNMKKMPQKNNKRGSRSTLSPLNSSENILDATAASENSISLVNLQTQMSVDSTKSLVTEVPSVSSVSNLSSSSIRKSTGYTPQYHPFEPRYGRIRSNTISTVGHDKTISLNNLPATPLTHPDRFMKELGPKVLFKETRNGLTDSSPAVISPANGGEHSSSTISGLDLQRSSVRDVARSSARKKSDQDLGLSPPHIPQGILARLNKEGGSERDVSASSQPLLIDEAKENRLRELLAEHRSRDSLRKQPNKEDKTGVRLQDLRCLKGSPLASRHNTNTGETSHQSTEFEPIRPSSSIQSSTPSSVLSLDTTSPPQRLPYVSQYPQSLPQTSLKTDSGPSRTPNPSAAVKSSSKPPVKPSSSPSLPLTPSQISASKAASTQATPNSSTQPTAKSSGKKSKDRERRRSLIQVVADMFKSSDDSKKKSDSVGDSTPSSSPPASSVSLVVPKSPVTSVRDKFARLRLARKDKGKTGAKTRSASTELLDDSTVSAANSHRMALSLPTSPAHSATTPSLSPSSLTYSSTPSSTSEGGRGRGALPLSLAPPPRPPHASGSGSSSPKLSSLIEEESLTDESSVATNVVLPSDALVSPHNRHMKIETQSREDELKRLRQAQDIQRQLEECEAKTRQLEMRGVMVEKSLRGEPGGECRDEAELMGEWFSLVHEKTALARFEQELSIRARQLELEDRDARLQHQIKNSGGKEGVDSLLEELRAVREHREKLRAMLEQDRNRNTEENFNSESTVPPRETGV